MPRVLFADTFYWIALISPRDAFHMAVVSYSRLLKSVQLATTDEVFVEVANYFASQGAYWRSNIVAIINDVRSDPDVEVLPQTRGDFDTALAFYGARLDKDYSLTDCRSMVAMRSRGITEVLTNDHHFVQEGFIISFP